MYWPSNDYNHAVCVTVVQCQAKDAELIYSAIECRVQRLKQMGPQHSVDGNTSSEVCSESDLVTSNSEPLQLSSKRSLPNDLTEINIKRPRYVLFNES